jgi:NTP pyrophosphatase (non-canonical NTP hydrolase)
LDETKNLQQRIVDGRKERGFTTDPLRVFALLTEEIGEVAGELKRTWSKNYPDFDRQDLANEISDVAVLLFALADTFEIDVADAVERKFFGSDAERSWATAISENGDK